MESPIFDIAFPDDGKQYKGWVNPSDKLSDQGKPVSFHVVPDEVSFGYVSYSANGWKVNETRPQRLVELVGMEIEKYCSELEDARPEQKSH